MNKYETGAYVLTLFDRYGTKVETRVLGNSGLLAAQKEGETEIKEGNCDSYVIKRILHNSKDFR